MLSIVVDSAKSVDDLDPIFVEPKFAKCALSVGLKHFPKYDFYKIFNERTLKAVKFGIESNFGKIIRNVDQRSRHPCDLGI